MLNTTKLIWNFLSLPYVIGVWSRMCFEGLEAKTEKGKWATYGFSYYAANPFHFP